MDQNFDLFGLHCQARMWEFGFIPVIQGCSRSFLGSLLDKCSRPSDCW